MNIRKFFKAKLIRQVKKLSIFVFLLSFPLPNEKNFSFKFNQHTDIDSWWISKNNFGKNFKESSYDFYHTRTLGQTFLKINITNGYSYDDIPKFGETYLKYDFNDNIYLIAGRFYRVFSNYMNDELSSGHMLISNNARPMPKLGLNGKFEIKRNKDVFFTWGISHAKFKKNQYYSDAPFLHEKFVYIHYNFKKKHSLNVGLAHEAIWAGTTTEIGSINNPGNQPDTIKDFLKVFISADGPLIEGEKHANALGAHSGIWDFNYFKKENGKELSIYYQHYFEDTSSLRFANKTDGLWGIEATNYLKNTKILLEYLNTSNCCINPPYQNDNYYWNYQYLDGWKYENMIIGNPFVNDLGPRDELKLFHLGLSYTLENKKIKLKMSKINKTRWQSDYSNKIRYKILYSFLIQNINVELFYGDDKKINSGGFSLYYKF